MMIQNSESPTSSSKVAKNWITISGCEAIRKPKGSENNGNEEPKLKEYSNGTSEVTPTKLNRYIVTGDSEKTLCSEKRKIYENRP